LKINRAILSYFMMLLHWWLHIRWKPMAFVPSAGEVVFVELKLMGHALASVSRSFKPFLHYVCTY
jgi:hypothetical protein